MDESALTDAAFRARARALSPALDRVIEWACQAYPAQSADIQRARSLAMPAMPEIVYYRRLMIVSDDKLTFLDLTAIPPEIVQPVADYLEHLPGFEVPPPIDQGIDTPLARKANGTANPQKGQVR